MIEFPSLLKQVDKEETVNLQIVITIEFGMDTYIFKILLFLQLHEGAIRTVKQENTGSALQSFVGNGSNVKFLGAVQNQVGSFIFLCKKVLRFHDQSRPRECGKQTKGLGLCKPQWEKDICQVHRRNDKEKVAVPMPMECGDSSSVATVCLFLYSVLGQKKASRKVRGRVGVGRPTKNNGALTTEFIYYHGYFNGIKPYSQTFYLCHFQFILSIFFNWVNFKIFIMDSSVPPITLTSE